MVNGGFSPPPSDTNRLPQIAIATPLNPSNKNIPAASPDTKPNPLPRPHGKPPTPEATETKIPRPEVLVHVPTADTVSAAEANTTRFILRSLSSSDLDPCEDYLKPFNASVITLSLLATACSIASLQTTYHPGNFKDFLLQRPAVIFLILACAMIILACLPQCARDGLNNMRKSLKSLSPPTTPTGCTPTG